MEPVLSNVPQFILASINALITATVARYVMDLRRRLRKSTTQSDRKVKAQWYLILFGWWAVALSAVFVLVRIIMASAWSKEYGVFDLSLVILTLAGYVLLASVNCLAWPLRPWQKNTDK
jgi:cellobiose-specific phosphotransferase system component IIC